MSRYLLTEAEQFDARQSPATRCYECESWLVDGECPRCAEQAKRHAMDDVADEPEARQLEARRNYDEGIKALLRVQDQFLDRIFQR